MPAKKTATRRARVSTRPLTRKDWPIIDRLFGPNGACGGCWCMLWRAKQGGKAFEASKGEPNKRAFKKLVAGGQVFGALAFREDEAVGWCSVGPRADFPGLERSRVLQTDWRDTTWSVTCFYIPTRWRHRGVAVALLREAVNVARDNGATELEAYPVTPYQSGGNEIPGAFAWTGVQPLFEKLNFRPLERPEQTRIVYVRRIHSRSGRKTP